MVLLYLILIVIVLLFISTRKSKSPKNFRKVPVPDEYPIIGNVHLIVGVSALIKVWEIAKKYSTPFMISCGSHQTILVDKPEDIQKLALFPKLEAYDCLPFTTGLLTQRDHSIWKPQRNFILPVFKSSEINNKIPIFNKYARLLVDTLAEKVGTGEFDIKHFVGENLVRQNAETLYGIDLKPGEDVILYEEIERMLEICGRNVMIYNLSKPVTRHLGLAKLMSRPSNLFIKFAERILASRQKSMEKTENQTLFVDRVVEMKENTDIKHVNVIDHLAQLTTAAVDTSTHTIANIVLLLAMHPEIQEKCFAEIINLIPNATDNIDPRLTSDMPYLTMVIKESMRVIPTVPYIGKLVNQNVELENYDIPAGSDVIIMLFTLFRNKEIWGEDADEFNPDHFLPEREAKRHKYAYLPFSFGPRTCIGARYAMVSMKVHIIHLLLNFKFSTSLKLRDLVFYATLSTSFVQGNMIRLKQRSESVRSA